MFSGSSTIARGISSWSQTITRRLKPSSSLTSIPCVPESAQYSFRPIQSQASPEGVSTER